jgi:hypothetical protein
VSSDRDDPFAAIEQAAGRQAAAEQAARALAAARVKLILGRDAKSAFFATLVLRLTPEADWEVETLATDGRALRYSPPFVVGLSPDELAGVLAHEVMHCALAHPARRAGRDPERWNVACDLAVNGYLGKVHTIYVGGPGGRDYPVQPPCDPPEGFDYDMWTGPAPYIPFDKKRCEWLAMYMISHYCAGFITNWGVHYLDIAGWGCPEVFNGRSKSRGRA